MSKQLFYEFCGGMCGITLGVIATAIIQPGYMGAMMFGFIGGTIGFNVGSYIYFKTNP